MADTAKTASDIGPPEPRWPSILALLAVGGLYLAMPSQLTPGPNWLVLVVVVLLLVPVVVTHRMGKSDWNHRLGLVLASLITLALIWSVGALIASLPARRQSGVELLVSAGSLWVTTVLVFASWYWRLDAGGPHLRDQRESHVEGAFLFPQMTLKPALKNWRPGFVDYLFLAFTTSTAFSPTDTPPLTRWAKMLMMMQSVLSLGTIAILAGRAVNMF
jgi:uncharacterized membrane protein